MNYPDGRHFVMVRLSSDDSEGSELRIVLRWPEALKGVGFSGEKR